MEFIKNYKFYLSQTMEVFRGEFSYPYNPANMGREAFYPKGIIDNRLIWWFVHSEDAESSVVEWNVRRQRVNLDNVAVIMVIMSDDEAYRFEQLDIDKKIGIYYKDLNLNSVLCCKEWENNPKLWHDFNFNWNSYTLNYFSNSYGQISRVDWIRFLCGNPDYVRY